MTLIVRRGVNLTAKEESADAHFAKCFAERKALTAAGRTHDDQDNHIDDYCHFDWEGYAEPCEEYGRLSRMEATNDQRAEDSEAATSRNK